MTRKERRGRESSGGEVGVGGDPVVVVRVWWWRGWRSSVAGRSRRRGGRPPAWSSGGRGVAERDGVGESRQVGEG